jgi:hypothetical protein
LKYFKIPNEEEEEECINDDSGKICLLDNFFENDG